MVIRRNQSNGDGRVSRGTTLTARSQLKTQSDCDQRAISAISAISAYAAAPLPQLVNLDLAVQIEIDLLEHVIEHPWRAQESEGRAHACAQWQSMAINGTQWHSMALNGNQWHPMARNGTQRESGREYRERTESTERGQSRRHFLRVAISMQSACNQYAISMHSACLHGTASRPSPGSRRLER